MQSLLSHQRVNRGDDGILHSTCHSILSLYEKKSRELQNNSEELECLASCVCSKGVVTLIESALSLYEEYPSMEKGSETETICLQILSLLCETDIGCQSIRDHDLSRSRSVRWMVLEKYGETQFGPGFLDRMRKYIPSEEEMRRLCSN